MTFKQKLNSANFQFYKLYQHHILMLFNNNRYHLVLLLFLVCCFGLSAQDLSNIGKNKNPIKVSGGVSVTNIFYGASGIQARRSPWSYFVAGSVNIDVYGFSIPLNVSYSNQKGSFTQPFNQFGMSPKYKWITAHAGYRTMSFSPYSLAGHIFMGGGVDLTPGIYRISAMYGRLNKGVSPDTLKQGAGTPLYERWGYGLKLGIGKNGHSLDVMFFKARDLINSLSYQPRDLAPAENLVIGLSGKTMLLKRVTLGIDYGASAYTRDTRVETVSETAKNPIYTSGIFTPRASTSFYHAFKTSVMYAASKYSVQLAYERIDPGYLTMGSYFFNNDMENITVNTNTRLLKDKMNLSLNVGTQRNNLDKSKLTTTHRLISSANINYNPIEKLNLTASYSNFTTNSKIQSKFNPLQQLDSLDYYQLTQSANAGVNYSFGNKERKKGVSLNGAYQVAGDNLSNPGQGGKNSFYNVNFSYRYSIVPKNLTFNVGANYNENQMAGSSNSMIGPTASVTKALFKKKLRSTVGGSWNIGYAGSLNNSRVVNIRWMNSYTLKKKHTLNVSLVAVNRYAKTTTSTTYTEFTGTVGYSYSF